MGCETLLTDGKMLTDEKSAGDIVSKYVTESAQDLICKLRGRGRESSRVTRGPKSLNIKKTKRARKKIKRTYLLSFLQSLFSSPSCQPRR